MTSTPKHLKNKVSCKEKKGRKEWMTGEAMYGELKGGVMVEVGAGLVGRLAKQGDQLFKQIALFASFEVCLAANHRLWIKADNHNDTILIYNIFRFIDQKGIEQAATILDTYKGFFSTNQQV